MVRGLNNIVFVDFQNFIKIDKETEFLIQALISNPYIFATECHKPLIFLTIVVGPPPPLRFCP